MTMSFNDLSSNLYKYYLNDSHNPCIFYSIIVPPYSRSEQEALGWQDKVSERRMDTLSGSYSSLYLGNPLTYLFNSTLCYVVSGVAILVVGVIITSVTFQNLDPLHEGKTKKDS